MFYFAVKKDFRPGDTEAVLVNGALTAVTWLDESTVEIAPGDLRRILKIYENGDCWRIACDDGDGSPASDYDCLGGGIVPGGEPLASDGETVTGRGALSLYRRLCEILPPVRHPTFGTIPYDMGAFAVNVAGVNEDVRAGRVAPPTSPSSWARAVEREYTANLRAGGL